MAAHTTTRSRAIGSSLVPPKNDTMRNSGRIAHPVASTLHQPNGTHHPITANAAMINTPAVLTARKNPATGNSEVVIRPKNPRHRLPRAKPTLVGRQRSPELLCPGE
jgi:hypothetical protein